MKDKFKEKLVDVLIALITLITSFIGAWFGSSNIISKQETQNVSSNNVQNYGTQTNNFYSNNLANIPNDNIVEVPLQVTENFETSSPIKMLKNDTSVILTINKDLFKPYYNTYRSKDEAFQCGIRLYDKNAIKSWKYFIGVTWEINDELNINNAYAMLYQMKEDKDELLDTGKCFIFQMFSNEDNYILFGNVINEYINIDDLTYTPLDMYFMVGETMYIIH